MRENFRLVGLAILALTIAAGPCQSCFETPASTKSHPCCPAKKTSPPCHKEQQGPQAACPVVAAAAEPAKDWSDVAGPAGPLLLAGFAEPSAEPVTLKLVVRKLPSPPLTGTILRC